MSVISFAHASMWHDGRQEEGPNLTRTLVHNGMLYELSDASAAQLAEAGIIVPDPDRSADFVVPLSHTFDEVEPLVAPAHGHRLQSAPRIVPIAVAGRGRDGQR